ncbi:ROK family protein [Saccharopolyspora sp. NFXS83]|uniref:ROK family protein n=1 Tax=Saccharopolyspora sp. NFXS83 TaxID=2993560 RepID=UPI00224B1787|nr:ROK family protein [Saccharopolyspora sp. NFXS83]MCX2731470.1 ROK family protein [Saccharopolyspora sp. NFXS83]
MTEVVGVDIGGTGIAAALVTADGRITARSSLPTPAAEGAGAVLDAVSAAVGELGAPFAAAGVGSAGVIDRASGRVRSATDSLAGWAGTDLRGELAARLGVPVTVDNDVHAHALGELWTGAAAGKRHVLFVAVGTGIGGSLIIDGRPHHGAHAVAGHVGHLPVPAAAGKPCPCGGSGHAEGVGSGPALLAEYLERGGSATTLPEVAALAESGDALASDVLTRGATATGQLLGGLVNAVDPELVLVGGGVSSCGPVWWSAVRAAVAAEALPAVRDVPVVTGGLGSDAAVLGAARMAWDELG